MNADEIAKLPYRPCVGLMILSGDNQVFAGQRRDNPDGAWQMPQGGIDPGEAPLDAALRELGEETGIQADQVELLAQTSDWISYDLPAHLVPRLWKGRYRGQKQLWFLFRFIGDDADINIETEEPEFSAWTWFAPEELLDRIVPFKKETYRNVIATFQAEVSKTA